MRSPSFRHQPAITLVKKTKFQEEQEDVNKPAWVLSGSPWVTVAFAIVQLREIMSVMKNKQPPAESESLQVKLVLYLNEGGVACDDEKYTLLRKRVKIQLIYADAELKCWFICCKCYCSYGNMLSFQSSILTIIMIIFFLSCVCVCVV